MDELKLTIAKIERGETLDSRADAAEKLALLAGNLTKEQITPSLLKDLIKLLDSPDDAVRYWVAMALGNIGPAASIAAPKLEEMLPSADCIDGTITSAGGIRIALLKMNRKPRPRPDPPCGLTFR